MLFLMNLLSCIVGKIRISWYMSNAGLYERMRFRWRKVKVWQSWVPIWAEDTLCTGPQHLRYPHKSSVLGPWTLVLHLWPPQAAKIVDDRWRYPHQKVMPHLVFRALQLKAGSPPIVFTYLGQPLENLQLGPSGFHLWIFLNDISLLFYRIRKQSFSRQGRGGEAPMDSGFW